VSNLDDARQWHEMTQHLVEAHGADSGAMIAYAPTLEQLKFAHADTHVALANIGALPPDRHTHPLPLDAGWYEERESSYRPFLPSASARDDPFAWGFPMPYQTGLPQTDLCPLTEADLADWAAVRPLPDVSADGIKGRAAIAAARWLARASFPGAPGGELVMRARADAQYAEWHRHYRDRPEILEEIERLRAEAGDLHAAHPIFLGFLERRIAEKLRGQQGARLQAGAGGPGPAAAAPEAPWLAGISFPGPVQPSPPPLSGRKTSRTPPPPGQRATRGWRR
jgi:hypothetical protein